MIKLHTNHGVITLELFENEAPLTCENFSTYVKQGFYNGLIFHRVIKSFMIQGGGFEPGMQHKATNQPIKNEANNGIANQIGTIAMARTSDPHSASSQFFINTKDNDFLNFKAENERGWGYCAFGRVTDGMEVVRAIENVPTGTHGMHQDVPKQDVLIELVEIV